MKRWGKSLPVLVATLRAVRLMGPTFKGVYNMYEKKLNLFFSEDKQRVGEENIEIDNIFESSDLDNYIAPFTKTFREDINLIESVYPAFDREQYLKGRLAPVFFGSALNNFGVRELLNCFIQVAPSPTKSVTEEREITPYEEKLTGFVFKIHDMLFVERFSDSIHQWASVLFQ